MKNIWGSIVWLYSHWLHPAYNAVMTFFANNLYAVLILLIVAIVLSIVKKKIKISWLSRLMELVGTFIIILLIVVAYYTFSPAIIKFFKSDTKSTQTTTPTKKSTTPKTTDDSKPDASPSAPITSGETSIPTYTAPKQLFYSVSCTSCYAEGCPRDGYYYSGYDAGQYSYYYGFCKACSCSSVVAHSFWK